MKQETTKQVKKLATVLGISALDGSMAMAALAGLFKPENIPILAALFIAGPGAIITASLLEGEVKQRVLVALIAGTIATVLVMFAAGVGPRLLDLVNINVIRVFGGISVGLIALAIAGVKIPNNSSVIVLVIGIIGGIIFR